MRPSILSHSLVVCATIAFAPLAIAAPAAPVAPQSTASTPVDDAAIQKAIDSVYPSLVLIRVLSEEGEDGRMKKVQGSGSGAIISPDGYVVTNHHVAGRGTRFVCRLSNREEIDATLVGTDALADIAVIKLDLSTRRLAGEPLPVARFGDSSKLEVGDPVLAMGSPGGLSQSITRGIVANTEMIVPRHMISMTLDGEKVGELVRWIGHDAVIYPGNSGGPLVNLEGEIIGVNEVGIASLGGAIPSNIARQVAAELIAKGTVTRGWIGLEAQPLLRSMPNEKGALVATVLEGSPAERAGIQAGDFITGYNGTRLPDCHAAEDIPTFNALVFGSKAGSEAVLTGLRDGKETTWKLTVEERQPNQAKEIEARGWGLTLRDLTRVGALEMHRDNTNGVLVDTVKGGGPSAESRPALAAGDVITAVDNKTVNNCAELVAATEAKTKGKENPTPVLVSFDRGMQKLVTVVKVGPTPQSTKPLQAEKPWFGASTQVLTPDLAEALGVTGKKGVRVTAVAKDSPAGKAGVKEGDLFLKLDGKVINASRPEDSDVFAESVRGYAIDSVVEVTGTRDGQAIAHKVTLGKVPSDDADMADYKDDLFEFTVRDLSATRRESARVAADLQGVVVEKITPNGWAALAGLVPGDIIMEVAGEPVPSTEKLIGMLKGFRESKPRRIVLFIKRGVRNGFLEIEPRW